MKEEVKAILPKGFNILRKLGEGSASVVWEVENEHTGQKQALKMTNAPDPSNLLLREYAILKRLEIPGVVKVGESGKVQTRSFFSMELIRGKSFTGFFDKHRKEEDYAACFLEALRKTAEILSDLHKQGIVHTDIKPSNVLLDDEGNPVLLDFGFSEDYILSPTAEPAGTTLDYAAPELFSSGLLTPAADIYSLGAMAFEVVSGKKVWAGNSPRELIVFKLKSPPGLGKLKHGFPAGLEGLILRMLNPEPSLRPSADEVIAEILWLSKGKRISVPGPGMVPRLVFGGREHEIEKLERLAFGDKRVVILEGESGIGKTRLLRELRFKALLEGRSVLHIEGRGAHASITEYLAASLESGRPEGSEETSDAWSKYERVFQTINRAGLDALLIDAPVDLTEPEKGLLGYLARGFDRNKGLIMTHISPKVHPTSARVELGPLENEQIRTLIERTFGRKIEREQLSLALENTAKGNPRKMNELLEILHSEGWLVWNRGWVYEPRIHEARLGLKLENWLGSSISRLHSNSRKLLEVLSLAEDSLPESVIHQVSGNDVTLTLNTLTRSGYIRPFFKFSRVHYEFSNDLVRPYVQGILPEETKIKLSGRIAEAIENDCTATIGKDQTKWDARRLSQIGTLYFVSGNRQKAGPFLAAAGRRFMGSRSFLSSAKKLLSDALECNPSETIKAECLYYLGYSHYLENNLEEAEKYYSQTIALSRNDPERKAFLTLQIGWLYQKAKKLDIAFRYFKESEMISTDSPPAFKFDLNQAYAFDAFYRGKLDESQSLFEKGLTMATRDWDRFKAMDGLISILYEKGDSKKAYEYAVQAIRLAEEHGEKGNLCQLLLNTTNLLRNLGMFKTIDIYLQKAYAVAKEVHHPFMELEVLRKQAFYLVPKGHNKEALGIIHKALEIAGKLNDFTRGGMLKLQEAQCLFELGEWIEAEDKFVDLWKTYCRTASHSFVPVHILENWAILLKAKGKFKAARRMLDRAEVLAKKRGYALMSVWIDLGRVAVRIEEGNLTEAGIFLQTCKEALQKQHDCIAEAYVDLYDVELKRLAGNLEAAEAAAFNLAAKIEGDGFDELKSASLRTYGRVLLETGKLDEGFLKLNESLEVSKRHERPFEQALTLSCIAESRLKHRIRSEEAESTFEDAERIFNQLGADYHLGKLRSMKTRYHFKKYTPGDSFKYLEGIRKINELINRRLEEEDFMSELLSLTVQLTGAERGIIFLKDADELRPMASHAIDKSTAAQAKKLSRAITIKLLTELEPVYTSDALADKRFNKSKSLRMNRIRSFICVPLKSARKLLGTIYLDSKKAGLFTRNNLVYFENLANLLSASIYRTVEFKKLEVERKPALNEKEIAASAYMIGSSGVIRNLYADLGKVAESNTNILIEGETGTGKGVFARIIHEKSNRAHMDFCSINCGVLPENLFESELFGTRKGAYTGATQDRPGLLEAAHCSTVFFDEITNTSLSMQSKLLEVIEERVIRRMGDTKPRKVDLRFIFATNKNLQAEVRAGRFREDLYFRLNAFTLRLPPLKDRAADIPEFVDFFIKKFSREFGKDVEGIEEDALELLISNPWPGNVRELRNVIESSIMLCPGKKITRELLRQHILHADSTTGSITETDAIKTENEARDGKFEKIELQHKRPSNLNLEEAKNNLEKELIRKALAEHKTLEEAAKALGINRRSLWRKKKNLGL